MRVFISWRGANRKEKNKIVEKLRSGLEPDIEIWESDEDCISDFSEECIQAIRDSQVFVVLISDEAMEPSYLQNEVQEAHSLEMQGKLNMLIFGITDTPLTAKLAGNLNHVSDVNRVARLAKTEDGYDALVRKVARLIALRKAGKPEKPYEVEIPEIEGVSIGGPGYFVEGSRDEKIREIDEAFERSNILFTTQISGYGKRSVVRKYVEERRSEYDSILAIHTPCSSITDFFLSALHFKNINESLYDGLDEKGVVLKKAELLSKLDKRTLIVVPDIEVGRKDGSFIHDVLAGIKCRIIFVTQRLSKSEKDILSSVEIGRMENRFLKELFFHYYTLANEDEIEELTDCLYSFFNDVGGHTKSVELVASALDEECDVYPEDIPDLFREMNLAEMSELGERIFGVISEMYDIRNFSDKERRALLVASLVATSPIDRKKFIGILKDTDAFDSETVRKLEGLHWLDSDNTARTVSIDATLAGVCLKKISLDKAVFYRCLSVLLEDFVELSNETSILGMSGALRRLSPCLKRGGFDKLSRAIDSFDLVLSSASPDSYVEVSDGVFEEARATLDEIKDEKCKENLSNILEEAIVLSKSFSSFSGRKMDRSVYDSMIAHFSRPEVLELFESAMKVAKNERVSRILEDLSKAALTGNFRRLVSTYIPAVVELIEGDDPNAEMTEGEQMLVFLLSKIGFVLVTAIPSDAPVAYMLARAVANLDDYYGCLSKYERYLSVSSYFASLCSMKEATDESDGAFARVMDAIKEAKDGAFSVLADYEKAKAYQVFQYAKLLLTAYRDEDALKAVVEHIPPSSVTEEIAPDLVECIEAICMTLLECGACTEFIEVVRGTLIGLYSADTDKKYAECKEGVNNLIDIVNALEGNAEDASFADSDTRYLDYYKSFSGASNSRRDTERYTAVADGAKKFDFSSRTREDILEVVRSLKERAKGCRDMMRLAPEIFALVSEAGYRVLGYRHHYVQYIGAAAILDGRIAQLQNGEGKTYTIVLPAVVRAIFGEQVTVGDMSDYLAKRNYDNMRGVYEYLGIKVVYCANRLGSYEALSAIADGEVIYGDMASLIFAKMHNETSYKTSVNLKYDAIIIDEADQAMIESGRQTFNIVTEIDLPVSVIDLYEKARDIRDAMLDDDEGSDRFYSYDAGVITLKSDGYDLITDFCGDYLSNLPPEAEKTVVSATKAGLLVTYYERDTDYFLNGNTFYYENKSTGKFVPFAPVMSYFLAIEEGIAPSVPEKALKLAKMQNIYYLIEYIKGYRSVAGTTATAVSMSEEFSSLYSKEIYDVPTNVPVVREDYAPQFFFSSFSKDDEILALVKLKHSMGQPVLLITSSIQSSIRYSDMLREAGIECTLLNAKTADKEAEVLSSAGVPYKVTVATALANRGVDIILGGDPRRMAYSHLMKSGKTAEEITRAIYSFESEGELALLKENYLRLVAMYRQSTDRDRDFAESVGGLCVIGTECFDDLRIEQQMRGRAGRQGRRGESYVFYSLDDGSVRELFGSRYEGYRGFISRLEATGSASSGFLGKVIRSSRLKIQHARYGYLKNMPVLIAQCPMRVKFLSIKDAVSSSPESAMLSLFKEYILSDEELLSSFESAVSGAVENPLYTLLSPFDANGFKGVPRRRLTASLENAFLQLLQSEENYIGVLQARFITLLYGVWCDFINKLEEECTAAYRLWVGKKLTKHLVSFSEKLFASLTERALLSALSSKTARKVMHRPTVIRPKPSNQEG